MLINSFVAAFWSLPETWKKTRAAWSCTGSQIHGPILSQSLLLLPSKVSVFSFRAKASAGKLLSAPSNGPISVFISEDINLKTPFSDNTGHFYVKNFTQKAQDPEWFPHLVSSFGVLEFDLCMKAVSQEAQQTYSRCQQLTHTRHFKMKGATHQHHLSSAWLCHWNHAASWRARMGPKCNGLVQDTNEE